MSIQRYIKLGLARLTGDKENELVIYNASKAEAAFEKQLAGLKADLTSYKEDVREAERYAEDVLFPTSKITDINDFASKVLYSRTRIDEAKEKVKQVEDSIEFFTERLAYIKENVD